MTDIQQQESDKAPEPTVVFENEMYAIYYGPSEFKYRVYDNGELVNAPICYLVVNKQYKVIEEEFKQLCNAIEIAGKLQDAFKQVTKVPVIAQAKKVM